MGNDGYAACTKGGNQWSWKYQTIPCGRIKTKPYQKNVVTSCGDLEKIKRLRISKVQNLTSAQFLFSNVEATVEALPAVLLRDDVWGLGY